MACERSGQGTSRRSTKRVEDTKGGQRRTGERGSGKGKEAPLGGKADGKKGKDERGQRKYHKPEKEEGKAKPWASFVFFGSISSVSVDRDFRVESKQEARTVLIECSLEHHVVSSAGRLPLVGSNVS